MITPPTRPLAARHLATPADPAAAAALAARGLELAVVDQQDAAAVDAWHQVVARGFLGEETTPERLAAIRERSGHRRLVAVLDPAAPEPAGPVGTVATWVAELTLPGGALVPTVAVSAVTVAQTHHRRGVARALIEGELRTAVALGVPVASLTVSESSLYGRYGFGPAATDTTWRIDTRRAGWRGPVPDGRVDFVRRERFRALVADLHDRVRPSVPGEIDVPDAAWDTFAGTRPDAKEAGRTRAVQYADAAGEVRGLLLYTVEENPDDFTLSTATVSYLLAETPDAYAALWRFVLGLDLVAEVRASERSADEPLRWMLADERAARVELVDQHYVRVLDVPAVLAARRYDVPGTLALDVSDPLGLSDGRWVLTVDADGAGRLEPCPDAAAAPAGAAEVHLGVEELSTLCLGGVSVAALAAAGRLTTSDAALATRMLGWHVPPRLSFWY